MSFESVPDQEGHHESKVEALLHHHEKPHSSFTAQIPLMKELFLSKNSHITEEMFDDDEHLKNEAGKYWITSGYSKNFRELQKKIGEENVTNINSLTELHDILDTENIS